MGAMTLLVNPSARINRQHNLLVSPSARLFVNGEGNVRMIDPKRHRDGDGLRALQRVIVLDVDSGLAYGELHVRVTQKVLAGVLYRAWVKKPAHAMFGMPDRLCMAQPTPANHTGPLWKKLPAAGIPVGPLPGGFKAGIRAYGTFEDGVARIINYVGRARSTRSNSSRCVRPSSPMRTTRSSSTSTRRTRGRPRTG